MGWRRQAQDFVHRQHDSCDTSTDTQTALLVHLAMRGKPSAETHPWLPGDKKERQWPDATWPPTHTPLKHSGTQ